MLSRLDRIAGRRLTLLVCWAAAVAVVAVLAKHFWIPLDDGTLAQSAERVLHGQLPHRDFGDPYTGLNAMVGALAFRLFGVALPPLRIPLVAGFALWLPAVWLVARRFAAPAPALAATLLAAVLSVLTYPAAMPTWFGLFLTTWDLWFLLRFLEAGDRRWLVATGLAAGTSILFKVTGLYFVAAVLFTLAWHRAEEGDDGASARHGPGSGMAGAPDASLRREASFAWSTWLVPVYPPVLAGGSVVFLLLLGRLVLPRSGPAGAVHFFLPGLAVATAVVVRGWRTAGTAHHPPTDGILGRKLQALLADGLVLAAGLALPVFLFLLPYAASDAVGLWVSGVFLLPSERFRFAASPAGSLATVVPGLVGVGVLWASGRIRASDRGRLAAALAVTLLAAASLEDVLGGAVLSSFWYMARSWVPWLTLWGVWIALRGRANNTAPLFAVVATAALWALVQFPYTSPAYFFYLAPLAVLATLAVTARSTVGHGPVLAVVAGLHLVLGLGYVGGVVASTDTPLPGPRGGIRVSESDARIYGALTEVVERHLAGGGLWATPDAPEVYFLTGEPNPTPVLYEFLGAPGAPGGSVTASGPGAPPGTTVAVLNTRPLFSPFPAGLESDLASRGFTGRRRVGPFVVLWKEAS